MHASCTEYYVQSTLSINGGEARVPVYKKLEGISSYYIIRTVLLDRSHHALAVASMYYVRGSAADSPAADLAIGSATKLILDPAALP